MKKTVLYHIFFMSTIFFASGQQINGIIYYQNSNGRKAAGVQVSAFGCNSVYSQSNGMFSLYCNDKKAGQKLRLIIGDKDGDGNDIELVNARQLEWLRVPESNDHDPIEIIICYPQQKKQAVLDFHFKHLFSSSSFNMILMAQIKEFRKGRDVILEKNQEQAIFMASIDKDKASDLIKSAILKIEQEEDIDAALSIMDNDKLEQTYLRAIQKKQNADEEIQQIIDAYHLKISLLLLKLRYKEMMFCYQHLFKIYKENPSLAMYYDGRDLDATHIFYWQKYIDLLEETVDITYYLGPVYKNTIMIYMPINRFEGIIFQEKFIPILGKIYLEKPFFYKRSMQAMSWIYYVKGFAKYSKNKYAQAIKNYLKAVKLNPEINTQYFYNDIGLAYVKNKQFKEAKAAFKAYETLFPNDGRAYRNWGMYYALQHQEGKALAYLQKAVEFGYDDVKWFKTDHSMESLKGEKGFMKIIKKLNE